MTTKATGLCAKFRRAVDGGVGRNCAYVRTKNARKRPETERNALSMLESTFLEDWDENG